MRHAHRTRHLTRNDLPWGNKPARSYKHYIVSPDSSDMFDLDALRDLAIAWVRRHFTNFEVAIVYHDDNTRNIPHVHVVVNNTNLENGRRLQDPDPRALKQSIQQLTQKRGMSYLKNLPIEEQRLQPPSFQDEYMRRAEVQLQKAGAYSWVADIRARVKVARFAARTEDGFKSLLKELGVSVSENSA